jgi:isoleucyl-tRNA synthetase
MIGAKIVGQMADTYRKIRNTIRFMLANVYDFKPEKDALPFEELSEMHRYILSRASAVLDEVTDAYEKFEFYKVYRLLYNFCTIDLSSLYLDILKDVLYTWAAHSKERRSSQTVFSEILRILTLVVAPILPYTSEEVWKCLPCNDGRSVHLQNWLKAPGKWQDKNLETRWQRLLAIRSAVMKKLEEKREKREIGNSLEGDVLVKTKDRELLEFLNSFNGDLNTIFIVSHAQVEFADKLEESIGSEDDLSKFMVIVTKARGAKCERCWKYRETVGSFSDHPSICAECRDVVKEIRT